MLPDSSKAFACLVCFVFWSAISFIYVNWIMHSCTTIINNTLNEKIYTEIFSKKYGAWSCITAHSQDTPMSCNQWQSLYLWITILNIEMMLHTSAGWAVTYKKGVVRHFKYSDWFTSDRTNILKTHVINLEPCSTNGARPRWSARRCLGCLHTGTTSRTLRQAAYLYASMTL